MEDDMNRSQHLDWCKKRALEFIKVGDCQQAYASMASDMRKHSETDNHPAIDMGFQMLFGGLLNTAPEMEKYINGFN